MTSVVVLGKGVLARRICGWFLEQPGYELVAVVPVVPEPAWAPSLVQWCDASGIPVVQSGHYRDLVQLQDGGQPIDLAISVFYDKIIKPWFIEHCGRILNVHNGPLPRYRGVSPINWALKNGEIEHGVTMHELTAGIDTGPVIAKVTYSIYPEHDEVIDVYGRALEFAWTLFTQTMPLLDRIEPRPQDDAAASYYSRDDDERLGERRSFTREESSRLPV